MRRSAKIKPLVFAALLSSMALAAYFSGALGFLTFSTLVHSKAILSEWVLGHHWLALVVFVLGYICLVTVSLPGSQLFTMAGGLLFGTLEGAVLSVIGASIGATNIFLIASRFFEIGKAVPRTGRIGLLAERLRRDAWSVLLLLRAIPVVPFFALNLAAALVGMRIQSYISATVIGIIPGALAYSAFGAGLAAAMPNNREPNLADLMTPELVIATVAVCLMAIAAVPVKRMLLSQNKFP